MENWFWILGWSVSILAMAGNGLVVIVVCRKQRLGTKTNAFIVSLAVADFFLEMSALPSPFFCEMASGCDSQSLNSDGIGFMMGLFAFASGASLYSLVLDRFIAVSKPLKYLTFMKRRPVKFRVFVPLQWFNSKKALTTKMIGWLYTALELLFCAIVIFCFESMIRVVWKHERSGRILTKQLRFNHQVSRKTEGKSAVKMMAIVISLFLICYGIALRCSFVHILNGDKPCNIRYLFWF